VKSAVVLLAVSPALLSFLLDSLLIAEDWLEVRPEPPVLPSVDPKTGGKSRRRVEAQQAGFGRVEGAVPQLAS
jgi:hypothetical protein